MANINIAATIPEDLYKKAKAIADKDDRSFSWLIRTSLKNEIERLEKKELKRAN